MKKLKIEQSEILKPFLNTKAFFINQLEQVIFGTSIKSNMKVMVIKDKNLPVKEYLNKINSYLKDIIRDLRKSGTWKI